MFRWLRFVAFRRFFRFVCFPLLRFHRDNCSRTSLPLEDQKALSLLFKDQSVLCTTLISDHLHELIKRHEFDATNSTLRTHRRTALSTLRENGGVVKQLVLTTLLNEEIIYCEFIVKCKSIPLRLHLRKEEKNRRKILVHLPSSSAPNTPKGRHTLSRVVPPAWPSTHGKDQISKSSPILSSLGIPMILPAATAGDFSVFTAAVDLAFFCPLV